MRGVSIHAIVAAAIGAPADTQALTVSGFAAVAIGWDGRWVDYFVKRSDREMCLLTGCDVGTVIWEGADADVVF
jgi:hypothetical protein